MISPVNQSEEANGRYREALRDQGAPSDASIDEPAWLSQRILRCRLAINPEGMKIIIDCLNWLFDFFSGNVNSIKVINCTNTYCKH